MTNKTIFGDQQGKGHAVAVGETDGMTTGKISGEGVQRQTRLERVIMQLADYFREAWLEVRVLFEEPAKRARDLPMSPRV